MHSNLFYLETPPGTGFSTGGDLTFRDTSMAQLHLAAIRAFFDKHFAYSLDDFYIAGSDYAGVYIPMLAYYIE